jgi:hypothetical protein
MSSDATFWKNTLGVRLSIPPTFAPDFSPVAANCNFNERYTYYFNLFLGGWGARNINFCFADRIVSILANSTSLKTLERSDFSRISGYSNECST